MIKRWLGPYKGIAIAYVAGCVAVLLGGMRTPAAVLGLPLVFVSGSVFVGHLVTLDDDAPGGWSNQDRSNAQWRRSLIELAAKGVGFGVVAWVVFAVLL